MYISSIYILDKLHLSAYGNNNVIYKTPINYFMTTVDPRLSSNDPSFQYHLCTQPIQDISYIHSYLDILCRCIVHTVKRETGPWPMCMERV